MSGRAIRLHVTGRPADSAITAITSAPKPHVRLSSWTTIDLAGAPRRYADAFFVPWRNRAEVDQIDADIRLPRGSEQHARKAPTVDPHATIVRSSPRLTSRDFPSGTNCRPTSADVIASRSFRHDFGYKKIVGRPELNAAFKRPAASAA